MCGVLITQLDSIKLTLVVYNAEATFVRRDRALGPLQRRHDTRRAHWDRQYNDATLPEDVNELSKLWHFKTKPGHDAVVLKTVYKVPVAVHVFAFSMEDAHLFPPIALAELGTIRTQVDLRD
ncbi:hypothetical protein DFH11DRAFT_1582692 [Phellopilus nigrolimitatus]|nr:hypothetical protein DFH11DRAFT_1665983 [Phellopilus nigrolimitatus]KAH8108944.1 hypothetical protein DFH11DRAFT_1630416 [Phellopilus nigrolimitatus]KAH8115890.1 hypothetical protein DFH11DRAFT_1582692 [Phellopilus nigrolimitatus]